MITLRNYQDDGVSSISKWFKKVKAIVYVLSTGGGKTIIFTYLAWKSSLKNKKVLILVHRIELLRQVSKALNKFSVEHGIINPNYTPNFSCNIQVASVQTIVNRLKYLQALGWDADFIISDECHHSVAKQWRRVIEHFKNAFLLGVTATPERADGLGLGKTSGGLYDVMVKGPPASWLQDQGFLVRAKVFGNPEKIDLSDVEISQGDYQKEQLSKAMNKATITGDAVDHYKDVCKEHYKYNAPAIVFCVTVAHANDVARQFQEAGYKFYAVDGNSDDDYRDRIISGLSNGSVEGIVSCDIISEGTDIPKASIEIDLRPTRSKGRKIQNDGRVLRPVFPEGFNPSTATREERLAEIAASEKPYAVILDHVNNTERMGCFSWDDHDWTLEGEKKKKKKKTDEEPPVKVMMCESCFMQQEPAVVCIGCGHIMKAPRDTTPKQVDGKLREITEADLQKKTEKQEQGKAQTMEELYKIAKLRGHDPKWATHVYMGRQKKLEKLKGLNAEFREDVGLPPVVEVPEPPEEIESVFNESLEF